MKLRALAFLVVAAAAIDQHREARLLDQEALDGDGEEAAGRILEARHQPAAIGVKMRLRAVAENLERRQQRDLRIRRPGARTMRRSSIGVGSSWQAAPADGRATLEPHRRDFHSVCPEELVDECRASVGRPRFQAWMRRDGVDAWDAAAPRNWPPPRFLLRLRS